MKTQIETKIRRKTDKDLVKTLIFGKKKESWVKFTSKLSTSKRNYLSINLDQINSQSKDGDVVLIPGKVLGMGKISKKIKIVALGFSENAVRKLKEDKIEYCLVKEEIERNPGAKNVKLIGKANE